MGVRFLVLRRRLGMTQAELSRRSGVSRRIIGLVENCRWEAVAFGRIAGLAGSLGARLYPNLNWRAKGSIGWSTRRTPHSRTRSPDCCTAWPGWSPSRSASTTTATGDDTIVAFHPARGTILVVEIRTAIGDVHAMLGSIDVKVRLALQVARDLGWTGASTVVPALVVADERSQHRIVGRNAELFDRLSVRGRSARAWLRDPETGVSGLLFYLPMTDVRIVGVRKANRAQRVRKPATTPTPVRIAAPQSRLGHVRTASEPDSLP